MSEVSAHPETLIQHLGEEEHILGAVVPPIFQNSLFVFETAADFAASNDYSRPKNLHNYSRMTNPTLQVVEAKIAALEQMEACKLFVSGMAAISAAIWSCVQAGAHIVCVDTCYGPTRDFVTKYLPKFGVTHTMVEGSRVEEVLDAFRPETALVYLESPSSIVFKMQDVEAICRHARSKGVTVAMDNTYSTPLHQNPARWGVDIVLHTASKYLGGHSDIIAGALVCSKERMTALMASEVPYMGAVLPPFPAWLMLRGLRTLPLRLKHHQAAANTVADWLFARPEVEHVFHVGLAAYGQQGLAQKYLRGTGGLLSFMPKVQDRERVIAFIESLHLFQMGVSWGGFESLVVALEFQPMDWPEKRWVVRLYCGLEHPEDLIRDLEQAMPRLAAE